MRDLRKSYGPVEAVRGLSFEVGAARCSACSGPNGAGKTSTVEILEGYRERSGGEVSVLGFDPQRGDRELKERVGIVLQSVGFYPRATVRESVEQMAGFYPHPRDVARDDRPRGPRRQGGRSAPSSSRAASSGGSTWRWRWSATPS